MEIVLLHGDITKVEVDAIVNAANTSLLGGGGVDGAIHRAGGFQILEDCIKIRNRQGGCKVGAAVITTAGNLKAKHVIHTVGPRWNNGQSNEEEKLRNCYVNCLTIAREHDLKTMAIPNISTGIYKFPKEKAANIAIEVVSSCPSNLDKIIFVCYDAENFAIYDSILKKQKAN